MTTESGVQPSDSATREARIFRLVVEYDGTDFAGFQWQDNRERTIQGVLERAVRKLSGEPGIRIHGAGRTDAGVHALGQVIHFESRWPIPAERMANALNGELPRDVYVRNARVAEPGFHARFSATGRVYRYVLLNRRLSSAFLQRYAWHVRDTLDIDAMRRAAGHLTGVHDFASFGQPDAPGKSTVRDVTRLDVRRWKNECVLVTVRGNAFLRSMVRAFVGTLVQVGRSRLDAARVAEIRESRSRVLAPDIAPAHGLFLVRVEYDGRRFDPLSVERVDGSNEQATDISDSG